MAQPRDAEKSACGRTTACESHEDRGGAVAVLFITVAECLVELW